jgi:uncharacterized protein (DUF302 family)
MVIKDITTKTIQASLWAALAVILLTGCIAAESNDDDAAEKGVAADTADIAAAPQLIETVSSNNFADTVAKLRAGIEKRPLKLFAEIDHAAGAASIDMDLAPSTLFIFGNPKGGTPLMTKEPKMGIALPLKMHVYEADGKVMISYADMRLVAAQYGIDNSAQPIPNIADMLGGLAQEAGGSAD